MFFCNKHPAKVEYTSETLLLKNKHFSLLTNTGVSYTLKNNLTIKDSGQMGSLYQVNFGLGCKL